MRIIVSESRSEFRVRLTASDREVFDWMLTEFKSWVPKSFRRYDDGHWFVDKYQRSGLNSWLHQMSDAGATIVEEDGQTQSKRQQYRHQPPKQRETPAIDEVYRALHLLPTAPVKLIEAARKVLLIECHPDKGGRHEDAVTVNRAADELIKRRRIEGSNAA